MSNKTVWKSVNGASRSFNAMDDEHLANLFLHFTKYPGYPKYASEELWEEIEKRNLTAEFLNGAPYPWQDKTTGIWYIWDFEKNYIIPISGNKKPEIKYQSQVFAKWIDKVPNQFVTYNKIYPVTLTEKGFIFIDDTGRTVSCPWHNCWERIDGYTEEK